MNTKTTHEIGGYGSILSRQSCGNSGNIQSVFTLHCISEHVVAARQHCRQKTASPTLGMISQWSWTVVLEKQLENIPFRCLERRTSKTVKFIYKIYASKTSWNPLFLYEQVNKKKLINYTHSSDFCAFSGGGTTTLPLLIDNVCLNV